MKRQTFEYFSHYQKNIDKVSYFRIVHKYFPSKYSIVYKFLHLLTEITIIFTNYPQFALTDILN